MPSRFKSRQQALQTLFLADVRKLAIHEAIAQYYGSLSSEEGLPAEEPDPFGEDLAKGASAQAAAIDEVIARHSAHWRLERMPAVDRNILRLAVYEMKSMPTPSAVVIDQALELARRFSSDESLGFLNGVLDAINKELRPL
ncbi:MAG: transcription antitermination factor NusB [Bryobacteraceae bacterium]